MTKGSRKKVIPKKPGRKPTGKDPLFAFRMPREMKDRITAAAPNEPDFSKALRSVIEKGLAAKK